MSEDVRDLVRWEATNIFMYLNIYLHVCVDMCAFSITVNKNCTMHHTMSYVDFIVCKT